MREVAPKATAFDLALVTDVATACYSEEELAAKHNVSLRNLQSLLSNPVFKQQVEGVKTDLAKNGFLTKTRATSIINEDLLPKIQEQIYNLDTTPDDLAKIGNVLIKLAGVDAKDAAATQSGPAMPTINITLAPLAPPAQSTAAPLTIDVKATEVVK